MSVVIVAAFLIWWTPYYVMMMIFMFWNPDKEVSMFKNTYYLAKILIMLCGLSSLNDGFHEQFIVVRLSSLGIVGSPMKRPDKVSQTLLNPGEFSC